MKSSSDNNNSNQSNSLELFNKINPNTKPVTSSDVYWIALDAERDGVITVGQSDKICVNSDFISDSLGMHA